MTVAKVAIWALPVAALLAGCGGERAVNNKAAISIANQYHEDLLALSPGRQRLAMRRAILDSRNRCITVDNAGYQEEYRNMRMWVASCGQEQKVFAVYIAANGDVQVRDCADAGTLSLPRCEGLPPAVADPTMPEFKEDAADEAFKNKS